MMFWEASFFCRFRQTRTLCSASVKTSDGTWNPFSVVISSQAQAGSWWCDGHSQLQKRQKTTTTTTNVESDWKISLSIYWAGIVPLLPIVNQAGYYPVNGIPLTKWLNWPMLLRKGFGFKGIVQHLRDQFIYILNELIWEFYLKKKIITDLQAQHCCCSLLPKAIGKTHFTHSGACVTIGVTLTINFKEAKQYTKLKMDCTDLHMPLALISSSTILLADGRLPSGDIWVSQKCATILLQVTKIWMDRYYIYSDHEF